MLCLQKSKLPSQSLLRGLLNLYLLQEDTSMGLLSDPLAYSIGARLQWGLHVSAELWPRLAEQTALPLLQG